METTSPVTTAAITTTIKSGLVSLAISQSSRARNIGLNSLYVDALRFRIESFHQNIFFEVDLSTLRKEETNPIPLSIAASEQNEKALKIINRGNWDIKVSLQGNRYVFDNGHRRVEIQKITPTLSRTTIGDFLETGSLPDPPSERNISSRNELSLTGKEKKVILGLYGGKLESIIVPGQSEHFLRPEKIHQTILRGKVFLKTYGFLKLGAPGYCLSIREVNGSLWLVTTGETVSKVPYKIIEKLTKI